MQKKREVALAMKVVFMTCVVPVFNEEAVIESFLRSLIAKMHGLCDQFEIIVIDDGSRDATVSKIQALRKDLTLGRYVKLIAFSRNFGKEIALTAGLDVALGDVVFLLDADFQHPLALLPLFLQKWSEGYDMVYGIMQDRKTESLIKRMFARSFYWLMQKITQIKLPQHAGDFRLLDRKVVNALKSLSERSRFMKGLYAWVGFDAIGIPFSAPKRTLGKSRWHFMQLMELALTGITSFSDIPLRVWGVIGLAISFASLIYAFYIVVSTLLVGNNLPGYPTLVVAIFFLGGIQLLSVGILGEYIARIFTEVKKRPQYLIKHQEGFQHEETQQPVRYARLMDVM